MSNARITADLYSSEGSFSVSNISDKFFRKNGSSFCSIDSQKGLSFSDLCPPNANCCMLSELDYCVRMSKNTNWKTHLSPANISTAELKFPKFQHVCTTRMMQDKIAFLPIAIPNSINFPWWCNCINNSTSFHASVEL